jgi:hypothetical protein
MSRLIQIARHLEIGDLHPAEVTVEVGDSESPEDIAEAVDQDG